MPVKYAPGACSASHRSRQTENTYVPVTSDSVPASSARSTDALAWELANKQGSMWKDNHPARFGLVFGVGPMHNDEIERLDR